MIIEGQCPLCEWNAKQSTGHQDEDLIKSYIAKALMDHLRLKHARHDETRIDNLAFSTILSQRTKMGMIEFSLNNEMSQWDLDKARQVHWQCVRTRCPMAHVVARRDCAAAWRLTLSPLSDFR